MKNKISPSIMCADFFGLKEYINLFEKYKIDMIHVDVMDGSFVPNYTLGTDFIRVLKKNTKIPMDIHLMIDNPEGKIDWFDFSEGDFVSVHAESTRHLHKAVSEIKQRDAKAGAALNPATPICMLENVLDDIDMVLLMTVNPGFAGQKLIPSMLDKIKNLRKYLDERGYGNIEIEVDGNVSFENARLMRQAGANIFVAGTSSLFCDGVMFGEAVQRFKDIII